MERCQTLKFFKPIYEYADEALLITKENRNKTVMKEYKVKKNERKLRLA